MAKVLKITCLLFIANIAFSSFVIPPTSSDELKWEEGKLLTWKDFKGKANSQSTLHAYTRVGMKTDFIAAKGEEAELEVRGYFIKSQSWVQPDQKTVGLLAHEQLHFDICELYRRKLKKELSEFSNFSYDNFSKEANRIFNEVFQKFMDEQKRYDSETHHSKLKEKQADWNIYVKKEIKKLDQYAGQKLLVKVNS